MLPLIIEQQQAAITELISAKKRIIHLEAIDVPEFNGTIPALHEARMIYNKAVLAAEKLGVNVQEVLENN